MPDDSKTEGGKPAEPDGEPTAEGPAQARVTPAKAPAPPAPSAPAAPAAPKPPAPAAAAAKPTGAAGVAAAKAAAASASRPAATVIKSGVGEVVYRPSLESAPMTRRGFFNWLSVGWISFTAAMGGMVTAATRFMFPNVLFEPPSTFKAGRPAEYAVGKVDERWKESYGVWLVRTDEGFYALSTICTHLGCTPNWLASENKFKCPCHGSGFYPTGINFEGPAPRPLERYKITLSDDGQIFIDKNVKFQQEKGQWESPGAFLTFTG
ncbi:MAG TPA: ubiquinol-cytochrome c reductase iron-sulfur subunit [Candidatus Polarisedimenticolia bacterium]|jgi:cytochrome b6-f complex iron-sulfur subunit